MGAGSRHRYPLRLLLTRYIERKIAFTSVAKLYFALSLATREFTMTALLVLESVAAGSLADVAIDLSTWKVDGGAVHRERQCTCRWALLALGGESIAVARATVLAPLAERRCGTCRRKQSIQRGRNKALRLGGTVSVVAILAALFLRIAALDASLGDDKEFRIQVIECRVELLVNREGRSSAVINVNVRIGVRGRFIVAVGPKVKTSPSVRRSPSDRLPVRLVLGNTVRDVEI